MADGYNGWSNYETWNVKLWIDNEQGSYEYWHEVAQELWDDLANFKPAYASQTREDAWKYQLAQQLKNEHEENTPTVTGVYADLLNAALSEVDWYEIAESYLEEIEREAEEVAEDVE